MLLASWLSLMSLAAITPALAAEPGCPPTNVFNTSLDHLDGYRVFTGPDGTSQVAPLRIDSKVIPLMKTGKRLGILQLPTSPTRGVEIVVGPPNVDLPMHPAPGKEMFVLLGGSVTFTTKNLQRRHEARLGPAVRGRRLQGRPRAAGSVPAATSRFLSHLKLKRDRTARLPLSSSSVIS